MHIHRPPLPSFSFSPAGSLNEFSATPSAKLNIEEFRSTDLSHEANPPSFKRLKKTNDAEKSIEQEIHSVLISNEFQTVQGQLNPKVVHARVWSEAEVSTQPEDWSDIDDCEIKTFVLNDSEANFKKQIWEEMNADWIKQQECTPTLHLFFLLSTRMISSYSLHLGSLHSFTCSSSRRISLSLCSP